MKSDLTAKAKNGMSGKKFSEINRIKTYFMKMIKYNFGFYELVVNSSRWKEFFIYSKCEISTRCE